MKNLAITTHPMSKVVGFAILIATASFPLGASAQTVISSLPYTIAQSGLYVLNNSLAYSDASLKPAILVNAGNVTIDLKGFYISNLGAGTSTRAIAIEWINRPNVTVQNGCIIGFSQGVFFEGGAGGTDCISALIDNVRFSYIVNLGVVAAGARNSIIRNCQFSSTGYDTSNKVIPNANSIAIYDINSNGGNLIAQNNISGATMEGILVSSNDLADGNFVFNAPLGINCVDTTSKLKNNTVTQSATPYTGGTALPGTNF